MTSVSRTRGPRRQTLHFFLSSSPVTLSTSTFNHQPLATMAPKDVSEREITMEEVSKHNTQEDCWLVIGNMSNGGPKVYDVTSYLDDHPGGAEVMLDVAGQDADEFFEDIGHSNDAREELEKHLIGVLKMDEEEMKRRAADAEKAAAKSAGGGMNIFLILFVLIVVGLGYYKTQMA